MSGQRSDSRGATAEGERGVSYRIATRIEWFVVRETRIPTNNVVI